MASSEVDVEERNQCMDVVIASAGEIERRGENQIVHSDLIHVDLFHQAAIGHHLIGVNQIDQWFRQRYFPNAAHIETVNTLPPWNE